MPREFPECPRCGSRTVIVGYGCTVAAKVSEAGIERVVVEDEAVDDEPRSVVCGGCLTHEFDPATHPAAAAARDEEWPAWDVGW